MTDKIKPKDRPHYVNNKEFSNAVAEYVTLYNESEDKPPIPNYIASCFMKICERLSFRPNFISYTYRDEMVMDAVENCLKAIYNYDVAAKTRTGQSNAFSYFTQIAYFAFLRRIAKEKKQHELKYKYISQGGYEEFMQPLQSELGSLNPDCEIESAYIEEIKNRLSTIQQNYK